MTVKFFYFFNFFNMNSYRERLITGLAAVLQSNKPLSSITIADIVSASKVSKRTFYQFFSNKDDCFLALYEHNSHFILTKLIAAITPVVIENQEDLIKAINSIINSYLNELIHKSALMARLYIDILTVGQQGISLRHDILNQYALAISMLLNNYQPKNNVEVSSILMLLSGINEMALYHLNDQHKLPMENLKKSIEQAVNLLIDHNVI